MWNDLPMPRMTGSIFSAGEQAFAPITHWISSDAFAVAFFFVLSFTGKAVQIAIVP